MHTRRHFGMGSAAALASRLFGQVRVPELRITLDTGHFTDQNTTEWGKGNAPLKEVLQLMKREKYPFAACIEYEYPGKGTAVEEVRKCVEYARTALA